MKKLAIVVALIASVLLPANAQAAETKFVGGPLTNLDSQGATINIMLSNVPAKAGLYLQECVEAPAGTRPSVCNKAAELWISNARGASFLPTDTIKFKPAGSFVSGTTTVDCTVSKCGIFIRFDHTAASDLSEDQFIPLTFKAAAAGTTTLPADEITATINDVVVSTKAPITLSYRQFAVLKATSKAGAPLTVAALSPLCAINGMEITPLKGVGECAFSVTSAGNATASPATAILPIRLTLGVQTLGDFTFPTTLQAGKKLDLPTLTNFGEKVTYKATGGCTVSKARTTVKKGVCKIKVSAPGKAELWKPLNAMYTIKGK